MYLHLHHLVEAHVSTQHQQCERKSIGLLHSLIQTKAIDTPSLDLLQNYFMVRLMVLTS